MYTMESITSCPCDSCYWNEQCARTDRYFTFCEDYTPITDNKVIHEYVRDLYDRQDHYMEIVTESQT